MAKQAELLPVDVAQRRILAGFAPLGAEEVAVAEALSRVVAEDVTSAINIPPFANSSMDGFAVRSSDTSRAAAGKPIELDVVANIPAGSAPGTVIGTGQAARIMTGGPMPPGSDAVIPIEDVEVAGDTVHLFAPVDPHACVRDAGQDVQIGTSVLQPGVEIRYPQVALLSALGRDRVSVARRPVVGILSTGDELVAPGSPLDPGQIYNSNSPMLVAAVTEAGGHAIAIPSAPDDPESISAAMRSVSNPDLLLTSGGASVGDHDHIKDVLKAAGEVQFWRVRLRPGKPLLFGLFDGTPVIGLPGNPTSAAVTFELFVRPVIRLLLGAPPFRPTVEAVVDAPIRHAGGRTTYLRVRLALQEGQFHASPAGPQDSAMLVPLAHADGLLVADEERTEIRPGERATVIVWRLPAS